MNEIEVDNRRLSNAQKGRFFSTIRLILQRLNVACNYMYQRRLPLPF